MAYSYWRVQCTDTGVGGRQYFGVVTLEMRATPGGADQCSGGTPSASSTFGTDVAANAFDGNTGTFWSSGDGALPDWIQYQFASPVDVVEIALRSRSGSEGTTDSARIFEVFASNDGSSWTSMGVHYQPPWSSSETRVITVTGAVPGKHYWRIKINSLTNTATECTLDQMKMAFTPGGANKIVECFASGVSFGAVASNARLSDGVAWWSQAISTQPVWLAAQLSEPGFVAEVTLEAFNGWQWEAPRTFDVQSSPDGVTWTTEWSVSTGTWSNDEVKTFTALETDSSAIAATVDNVVLVPDTNELAPADATTASTADNVALTQANTLVVADAAGASNVDNVALVQANTLAPADSTGASTAENLTLTNEGPTLVVNDASSASTVDAIALTQANTLAIADATSASSAEAIGIGNPYATIVNGIVTAIDTGTLPESDETTLYFDLTGYETPEIGDHFDERCQVFSAAPPVIPPGEIAPPYKPGDDPPDEGDVDYPDGPDEPGPTPIAHLIPVLVPFFVADNVDGVLEIAAAPSALTSLSLRRVTAFDLTDACAVQMQGHVKSGLSDARLACQYYGAGEWRMLDGFFGPMLPLDDTGDILGPLSNIATGARGEVLLRPVIVNGDDVTQVEFGNLHLRVYVKADAFGACKVIEPWSPVIQNVVASTADHITLEVPDDCELPETTPGSGSPAFSEDFASYANTAALRAVYDGGSVDPTLVSCPERQGMEHPPFSAFGSVSRASDGFHLDWTSDPKFEVWMRNAEWHRDAYNLGSPIEDAFGWQIPLMVTRAGLQNPAPVSRVSGGSDSIHTIDYDFPTLSLVTNVTNTFNQADLFNGSAVEDRICWWKIIEGSGGSGSIECKYWLNGSLVAHRKWTGNVSGGFTAADFYLPLKKYRTASPYGRVVTLRLECFVGGDPYGLA